MIINNTYRFLLPTIKNEVDLENIVCCFCFNWFNDKGNKLIVQYPYHLYKIHILPLEYNNDFKLFLEGKYHKFSDRLKYKIINEWSLNEYDNIYKILFNEINWYKPNERDYLYGYENCK